MNSLATLLKDRMLVSVRRQGVDGYGVQGFVVGLSDELLALEYVYDFQVDGLLVLRLSDITDIKRTATDEFQESLLKREGIRPGSQQPTPLHLNGWKALIEQISGHYPAMILERELGPSPEFAIGRPTKISQSQVEFLTFSGTGTWSDKLHRFKYSQITSLQANSRYLNFYQKHFDRNAS